VRLIARRLPDWPKLAWVASARQGSSEVLVRHGPMVEASEQWVVEAVWAGQFHQGDFDRTDLLAGSGVRLREGRVVFVSSGTAVDRLWYCRRAEVVYVANSLPAMLAVADLDLDDDYTGYAADMESIDETGGGLSGYVRSLPAAGAELRVLYFANLCWDGQRLIEEPKPDTAPALETYEQYFDFLVETARAMGRNARSPQRNRPVVPVTTISSGYDSTAVAVIATHAGCRRAVTIRNPTSLWRGSDSGQPLARRLGLSCQVYRHHPRRYRQEEAVWAAVGRPRGLNLTIFDYPEPLCLFFTGNYGDKIWDLAYKDVSEPTGDLSGLCLCEFRLLRGIFHCMPAWWAVRHSRQIQRINHSEQMRPWSVGGDYDRPIARRIIEAAGVPRGAFARRKRNTSSEAPWWWPYDRRSQERFRRFLAQRGLRAPGPAAVWLIRRAAHLENLLHKNLLRRLGVRRRFRPWKAIRGSALVFHWANDELKRTYRRGLEAGAGGKEETDT